MLLLPEADTICGMTQRTFAELNWASKSKTTRRERFLADMERVVPWKELEEVVSPVAPSMKPGQSGGRPAYPVSVTLRIYLCQTWYNLSDDGMEDTLYDSESVRRFCLGGADVDEIPDERSIRRFRHLLEEHKLQEKLMRRVTRMFSEKGIMTKNGTIVDATIIHAPTSTKNESKQRDPEMKSTKKGNQWYFGMKCHVGVDAESGVVHTAICTHAKEADITMLPALLHGEESEVIGDRAYCSEPDREELQEEGVSLLTPKKKPVGGELTESDKARNRKLSGRRAIGEHPFHVIKNIFGYTKVRYRGIKKNSLHLNILCMLSSLYLKRRVLLAS
jgi:IS5 family transposase